MSIPGITMGGLIASTSGSASISITNRGVLHVSGGILPANVSYVLSNDSYVKKVVNSTTYNVEQWDSVPASVADYQARVTVTSGALTSGTTGSWLNLGTTRTWNLQAAAGNYDQCVFTVEIMAAGGGSVLDSATITLTADAT